MQITSLDQMESIVASNKNLKWDGWTVISYTKSATAWTKVNGAYVDGVWYLTQRFEPKANGWNIPNRLVKHAQK